MVYNIIVYEIRFWAVCECGHFTLYLLFILLNVILVIINTVDSWISIMKLQQNN